MYYDLRLGTSEGQLRCCQVEIPGLMPDLADEHEVAPPGLGRGRLPISAHAEELSPPAPPEGHDVANQGRNLHA